jgi:predicted amidophosphoribosyltransferase
VALFAAPPALAVIRWRRRLKRDARGLCRGCGYDLRASPGRCPECGRDAAVA